MTRFEIGIGFISLRTRWRKFEGRRLERGDGLNTANTQGAPKRTDDRSALPHHGASLPKYDPIDIRGNFDPFMEGR
jgi:hypothetical protein